MVDDAAQYFARYLHNSWELTHPTTNGDTLTSSSSSSPSPPPSGILIFLSIHDRVCFISTNNKLARTVLPWWRIEKIIVDMKPHIRKYDYTSGILTAISKIEYYVNIEGPPTFSEKVNDFFMRFGFLLTFALLTFVFAIWGEANAAYYYGTDDNVNGEHEHNSARARATASLSLNNYLVNSSTILRNHRVSKLLQQKRLKAMEKKSRLSPQEFRKAYRKQKDNFKCSYCPICLEPFQSVKVSIMRQKKKNNTNNRMMKRNEGREGESEPLLQTSASSPYQYLCTPVTQTTTTLIDNPNNDIKEEEKEETPLQKKCSILVGSDGVPIKLLRCGHVFDYECWRCWVSFGQGGDIHLCPICRQAIHSTPSSESADDDELKQQENDVQQQQQHDDEEEDEEESNNEPLLLFYTHQYTHQYQHQQQIQSSMRDAATNVDNTTREEEGGENLILNHFQSYGAL